MPCPKNAGAEPTPPKFPQPRITRETEIPLRPSSRCSTPRSYGATASSRLSAVARCGASPPVLVDGDHPLLEVQVTEADDVGERLRRSGTSGELGCVMPSSLLPDVGLVEVGSAGVVRSTRDRDGRQRRPAPLLASGAAARARGRRPRAGSARVLSRNQLAVLAVQPQVTKVMPSRRRGCRDPGSGPQRVLDSNRDGCARRTLAARDLPRSRGARRAICSLRLDAETDLVGEAGPVPQRLAGQTVRRWPSHDVVAGCDPPPHVARNAEDGCSCCDHGDHEEQDGGSRRRIGALTQYSPLIWLTYVSSDGRSH